MERAKEIHRQVASDFLQREGVTGVGVGLKQINGKFTDTPCVQVFVRKKMPAKELDPASLIPPTIDGVSTDVIEKGPDVPCNDEDPRAVHRPLLGGIQIVRVQNKPFWDNQWMGTITCLVYKRNTNDKYLLTAGHVLDPTVIGLTEPVDSRVYQPVPIGWANCVGESGEIVFGGKIDAGLAKCNADISGDSRVCKIGGIHNVGPVVVPNNVAKTGRTTGKTFGIVRSDNYVTTMGRKRFEDLFMVSVNSNRGPGNSIDSERFCDFGDSGAPVMRGDWQGRYDVLAGILIGMSGPDYGICCKIGHVLETLNIWPLFSG